MWTHHHHFLEWLKASELRQLYLSQSLRFFALSFVSVFIPLYLYKELGFTLWHTFMFFLVAYVCFAVSSVAAAYFVIKYGAKHSVLFSLPFILLHLVGLHILHEFSWLLYPIAILVGLYLGFYWMGMHLVFLHASNEQHRGEAQGKRVALAKLASAIGPLIGGFIIAFFGFGFLFLTATGIMLFSALILFMSSEDYIEVKRFSLKKMCKKKYVRDGFFYLYSGAFVAAAGIVWPIFIFSILGDYVSLGALGTVLGLSSALLFWIIGKWSDHKNKRKIVKRMMLFEAFNWLFRATVTTVNHVFTLTIGVALIDGFLRPPVGALVYDRAKHAPTLEYFVFKEIVGCVGRILVLVLVLATGSLASGFFLTSGLSLSLLFF